MLTLFLILAFIFIILIACVPTEKNSKDVAANSYEECGRHRRASANRNQCPEAVFHSVRATGPCIRQGALGPRTGL